MGFAAEEGLNIMFVCDIDSSESSSRSDVSSNVTLTNTLRAVYLLEHWRSASLSAVPLTTRLTRIMCIFLAGKHQL